MAHELTYQTNIFDIFGTLSSFSLSKAVWKVYEKHATRKIHQLSATLRGELHYLSDLTADEASKDLEALLPLFEALSSLRKSLSEETDEEFKAFIDAALEMFSTIELFAETLSDIANPHASYIMSEAVLATDWNRPEDDHWDNY